MAANDSYRLIVRRGPQPNQVYELNKDIVTLGRDITNDIVINDPEVSRHHLRFTRGADGFNIEDLGSTNGTFIGGQRLSGVRALKRGDLIGLGETVTLSYDVARPAGESASPPPQQYQQPSPPPQQQSGPPQQDAYQPPPPQQGGYQQPPPQQGGYQQPSPQQDYDQQGYDSPPPPDYGYQQPDYGYGGPQVPGYDYDPYAVREEEPASAWRWIVIGCAGMLLFCCCSTVFGLFIIDQAELWCDIPIFSDVVTPVISAVAELFGVVDNGGC